MPDGRLPQVAAPSCIRLSHPMSGRELDWKIRVVIRKSLSVINASLAGRGTPPGVPLLAPMEMAGSQRSGEAPGADQALLHGSVIGQRTH